MKTDELLRLITKSTDTLNKQVKRKPQKTLDIRMKKQTDAFLYSFETRRR